MQPQVVIEKTRQWISQMVIGLGFCPFAQRVFDNEKIRYVVSQASDSPGLIKELEFELEGLNTAPRDKVETTLIIMPSLLKDFLDFNDFTSIADECVGDLGLRGVIQIASFHPLYQFEGTDKDSPENYTNRSPFPILHLLREISITELNMSETELQEIPKRNIETLTKMGLPSILKRIHY